MMVLATAASSANGSTPKTPPDPAHDADHQPFHFGSNNHFLPFPHDPPAGKLQNRITLARNPPQTDPD
jgi:hypothetical protein